ncbi:MAG TPA: ferredoxin [Verrucomicrobiae bacterium]|jgi:ferredoxin
MAQSPRFEKGVGQQPRGIGEYFVSEQCIDCDLCRQLAPGIFQRKFTGTGGISVVGRQPSCDLEFQKADEAKDSCPVGAIQLMQQAAQLTAA